MKKLEVEVFYSVTGKNVRSTLFRSHTEYETTYNYSGIVQITDQDKKSLFHFEKTMRGHEGLIVIANGIVQQQIAFKTKEFNFNSHCISTNFTAVKMESIDMTKEDNCKSCNKEPVHKDELCSECWSDINA